MGNCKGFQSASEEPKKEFMPDSDRTSERKYPVLWKAQPTLGSVTDQEVTAVLDQIQKYALAGNAMTFEVRKEVVIWLQDHLEDAIIHSLGEMPGKNSERIIISRTKEDVEILVQHEKTDKEHIMAEDGVSQ